MAKRLITSCEGCRSRATTGARLFWLSVCWLLFAVLSRPVCAEIVELVMPDGVTAVAEMRRGDPGKPAVMILHGFLQTREFPTVRRLADSLVDSGYTVLAPTLSLGIDRRTQSLACEAIHTHTMENDIEEIWAWLDWLAAQIDSPIIAIGHSAGSLQLLAQSIEKPHPRVTGMLLVSLTYFGDGPADRDGPRHHRKAQEDLAAGVRTPREYSLSFCASYPAIPAAFLSYVEWSEERLLEGFLGIPGVRSVLILGGGDKRIDWEWIGELVDGGAQLVRIEGANHFFDSIDEFEFLDSAEQALDALSGGAAGQ